MSKSAEQSRSQLPGLILAVVESQPLHGYGIAREIEVRSADALSFGEGTLYPALKALELAGEIAGEWYVQESGPAKKVYRITDVGRAQLARHRAVWAEYSSSVNRILTGTPQTQTA